MPSACRNVEQTQSAASSPVTSAAELLLALSEAGLLRRGQLTELGALVERGTTVKELCRALLRLGFTKFQLTMALHGRADELTLGRYRLLERLGAGGMGEVYKAEQLRMDRIVALKVLRPELLQHPTLRHRFRREVRVASKLNHPHIVHVFDAECDGDVHYLVMDYVEGIDLARLIDEGGRLTVARACDYIRQAALGLQHAHEKGLVHRDVKPANLLVDGHRTVKLLDMGLARPIGDDSGLTMMTMGGPLTRAGTVLGTPDYMAPEQARDSSTVDGRADIYGLGATLVYLLTGEPPYPGGSPVDKLLKHQLEPLPKLRDLRPDAPPGLDAVLARLLAKKPEERYATAAEAAAALAPFAAAAPAELSLPRPEETLMVGEDTVEVALPTVPLAQRRSRRGNRAVAIALAIGFGIAALACLVAVVWHL